MNIQLAPLDTCTGCGACAFRCPKECIKMQENQIGIVYPVIDTSACIGCHQCESVCPILNDVDSYDSQFAYAAWSLDENERNTSASGGVAIEMYKLALQNGYVAVGALQNEDFTVTHKITTEISTLKSFKNSKYVFSDSYEAFNEMKTLLNEGKKVIFIGLPCQVAALRNLFSEKDTLLLLVEIVCHGTTPFSYLRQHIELLSKQSGKVAKRMSFRDPIAYTYTYTFTLYDNEGKMFYAKRTKDGDTYQFGYHRAVTYRENCYHCRFAKSQRISDITIADYHGLGLSAPCKFTEEKVSLILVNTEKGKLFVNELIENKCIQVEQRPLEEPFIGEPQLKHPTVKSKYRLMFEKEIIINHGDFENAIRKILITYQRDLRIMTLFTFPIRIARNIKKRIFDR